MNSNKDICKAFNKHAKDYDAAAKIQYEIGMRLFKRLDYLKISPKYILDLGCGTGIFTHFLKVKYPQAKVVGVDLAYLMLLESKKKQRFWRKCSLINADMRALPFAPEVFDLVFANQVLHWSESLAKVLRELNRVMKKNACLMFSTLGPDTFKEFKNAWSIADNYAHTNSFKDLHTIGDYLLAEFFADPVVDMEWLTAHYKDVTNLVRSLKLQGVCNINPKRRLGLVGRDVWQIFEKAYKQTIEGKYPLSYEVVYGQAWKIQPKQMQNGNETFIPISKIKRQIISPKQIREIQ